MIDHDQQSAMVDGDDTASSPSAAMAGTDPDAHEEEEELSMANEEEQMIDKPVAGPSATDITAHACGRVVEGDSSPEVHNEDEKPTIDTATQDTPTHQSTDGARPAVKRGLSVEDIAHYQQMEESRVVLELQADDSEPKENGGGDGLKQTETEEDSSAETTPFGLPQVNIESQQRGSNRRSSIAASFKAITTLVKELRRDSSQTVRPMVGPEAVAAAAAHRQRWATVQEFLAAQLLLLDALYILVSVPWRIGFLFDPWGTDKGWTQPLVILTVLDCLGELFRGSYTWNAVRTLYKQRKRVASGWLASRRLSIGAIQPKPIGLRPTRSSLFSLRGELVSPTPTIRSFDAMKSFKAMTRVADTSASNASPLPSIMILLAMVPFEVVAASVNPNWLHVSRVGKMLIACDTLMTSYSSVLLQARKFAWAQWLSFSTLASPFYLFWLGLYLCHITACGYMLLATIECGIHSQHCSKLPIPGSWVLKDNMEHAELWRRYVRTMYWASKTVTTLGQGDLVPATEWETNYCVAVQFISGLWATAFLASCSFYFSRRDRDIATGVSTRLEQSLRFLRSRKVPTTLSTQIRHYYQHIQRTRNGIEEEQVMANLPPHYQSQCAYFVKYRLIAKVPFFSKQPKAFLRSVISALDVDFFSPTETVIALFDIEELIVVARGDISVFNQERELVHVLSSEEWFAEDALFGEHRSEFELEARTYCEVFRLPRAVFISCMERHFPKLRIAAVISQQQRRRAVVVPRSAQPIRATLLSPRGDKSLHSSMLDRLRREFDALPWTHPDSRFRRHWRRYKAAFLIFLALAVPFEVAFKWRRGFFDAAMSRQVIFALSMLTELFFYVDLYFRARRFTKRASTSATGAEAFAQQPAVNDPSRTDTRKSVRADMAATAVRKRDDFVTKASEIWRLYLASDDVIFDILSTLPISIAWNFVNHEHYSVVTHEVMRCGRLLALVRLLALKQTLKRIMVEFDLSPASQLFSNVVVFCVITANAMACYFYLIADDKDFFDALPYGFDPEATPVIAAECLEQATLYGNCTWYIADRSTYSIEARYVRSLHWSIVLLSTVGYGDILSFTNSECLIGFWWIFLGALICYFTSCAVGSVVSQVTVLASAQDTRIEEITRALIRSNVSKKTRDMIRSHYEANWELNGSVTPEETLMRQLPRSLRQQLASALYLHCLRKCYVFAGFGAQLNVLRDVALAMSSMVVLPGFSIVEQGHIGDRMYLVLSGDVELLVPLRIRRASAAFVKKGGESTSLTNWWASTLETLRAAVPRPNRSRRHTRRLSASLGDVGSINLSSLVHHQHSPVPLTVLREGDCFGEEGLLPHARYATVVTARALTSAQVASLHRDAFLALAERYPSQLGQMIAAITQRREEQKVQFATMRANLELRDKVREFLGTARSAYASNATLAKRIITTDRFKYRMWRAIHGLALLYNFYQITFRIAFLPHPSRRTMVILSSVDYVIDAFLYADIYLKYHRFGYTKYGEQVTDLFRIRRRYKRGWLRYDLMSMVPLFYVGDYFYMTLTRLPRLLKSPQLLEYIQDIELLIRERFMKGSTTLLSAFDLVKFMALFLSAAHHIGSLYFLLGRLLTTYNWASASWMTVDPIITAHPDDVLVQYNRAVYWCLETFTVVCFGDVIARNSLETVYASLTCIIGWMCIGQVVGRITSLMASIDKDHKEHNDRVDNFEQYARNRKLPDFLRERAVESVEYKSKCFIGLNLRDTFEDLPQALHVLLFDEVYGQVVRGVPEIAGACIESQIRVLANAFALEIYVADDIIIEEGRLGSKLYLIQEGRAEYMSSQSRMVFAAIHEGVLFGDLAFFLTGTRQIASVRASKSCQVLQLDRKTWVSLWSEDTRQHIEAKLVVTMRDKYRSVLRAYLNIMKNFELAIRPWSKHSISNGVKLAGMGGSTTSIQSSTRGISSCDHSSGTDSNSPVAYDHPMQATPSPQETIVPWVLRKLREVITSTTKVVPATPSSLSRRRRRSSRKRSRQSIGRHRKLSVVLGMDGVHGEGKTAGGGGDTDAEAAADSDWQRHQRNLQVLNFIDTRNEQTAHVFQSRVTHSGNMDRHDPLAAASNAGEIKVDAERSAQAQAPAKSPTSASKRHSIQVDKKDLKLAFRSAVNQIRLRGRDGLHAVTPSAVDSNMAGQHKTPLLIGSPTGKASSNRANEQSTGSSAGGSFPAEYEPIKGVYASHLENLRLRSKRRQRQSLFVTSKASSAEELTVANPYEIWVEPPLPPAFCLETSSFRRKWNAVMLAVCLYYILVVPFRVSFVFDYLTLKSDSVITRLWFGLEYGLDVLCIIDFVLHNNFFTFVQRGTLVTDRRQIHQHYLREGSYVADLFCILPFELLIPLMPFIGTVPGLTTKVSWYRVAVFRLNKTIRIVHLHALGDKIQRMLVYDVASMRTSVVYFVRFAFDFALGAHWVACLFFGAAFNLYQDGEPSWLTTPGMLTFEGRRDVREVGLVPLLMKYSRSYHFSMGAITTVSYGDIAPQNPWETFVTTWVIVISIVLFGMLSGGFSQVFEMELGKRADYEEKIASVAHFMMFHKFPVRIWKHMQSYFMVHWSESQGMNDEELLSGLPTSVKRDITLYVKQDFVKQMKLFAKCDESFVRAVVVAFDQEFFVRNDVIITYGERGRRSLYVIERGHVLLRVPEKSEQLNDNTSDASAPAIEIVKGRYDFFGEKSLIFDIPRSATCIALSSCSMLILTLEKYEQILEEFPEYRERNMHDWVLANARENTPASAMRSPRTSGSTVVAKLTSKRSG